MGRILVRGEPGHDIMPALYPAEGEPVIDKPGKGAFYQTELELMLRNRGIENLLVCGVTTEVCVNTTVREANDRGYRCIVLADCCASYFPQFHEAGLAMIKAQGGIFGWVSVSQPRSGGARLIAARPTFWSGHQLDPESRQTRRRARAAPAARPRDAFRA